MGWGTMIPTSIHSAYIRGSVQSNTDGSLGILMNLTSKYMLSFAYNGANVSFTTTGATVDATDLAAIAANFSSARIISAGLRAYPNLPYTSAPGACFAGALPTMQAPNASALTPTDLFTTLYGEQFKAYEGAISLSHPQDTSSFAFHEAIVDGSTGWDDTIVIPNSLPFIAFSGIGSATTVFYEAVINFEGVAKAGHGASALGDSDDQQRGPTLSDYWPTAEKLWSGVKQFVSHPAVYGAASAAAEGFASSVAAGPTTLPFTGPAFSLAKAGLAQMEFPMKRYLS